MRLFRVQSLQLQLALSLAALYVAATAIAVAGLVYQAYSTADALSTEDLNRRARHLASLVTVDTAGEYKVELPDWLASLYRSGSFLYAARHPEGKVVAASNAEVADLVSRLPVPGDQPAYFRLRHFGASERDYFGLTAGIESRVGPLWITIARAADDDVLVQSLLREFMFNVAWLVPLVVAATLAIGVVAIRRGLRPLRQASAKAATIEPGSISIRLPEENVPSEVRPLVAAVNQALDRLEKGFAMQRQFTANAAHELRTPLAILTTAIEQLAGSHDVTMLKSDVARMNRLVEQLLRVARLDAIALDVSTPVDLCGIAKDVVAYMAPVALANRRVLAAQGTERQVLVKGNRYAIEDAIRNLIENAITYAPPASEIVVEVDPNGAVKVADRGPGIAVDERNRIFDRFWRGKGSQGQGSGLGLAIVCEIMKAHHGSIEVGDNPGGGAVFTLVFQELHQTTTVWQSG
ncbi:HAMP domain-containing protein [Bradyrhizobium sp. 200]|uniref:sensor histidine kinase n=1 Tax=Bradyrhizobium sp. 200 TaxID=2782665 RepID=UPI001FFE5EE3|nr:ATP-binding protein [Bradyrhizobium sp. 200]UPJ50540.1 HAMP domain-containing protein [Bradyrhizobium sp. 200]